MCGIEPRKMTEKQKAGDSILDMICCVANNMAEHGYSNIFEVLSECNCTVRGDVIDYNCAGSFPNVNSVSKINRMFTIGNGITPSTLTAAEYFANSDAYKEIKKVFALNNNITIDQIPDYLTSQGLLEDAAIRTDSILSWFYNTTYETCKKKDMEIANLNNQLNMMSSNSVPDTPVTSLTIDAATHVAMLEKDMQILEARLKRANEALKAAGLEEV